MELGPMLLQFQDDSTEIEPMLDQQTLLSGK